MLRIIALALLFWGKSSLAGPQAVSVRIEGTAAHTISPYIYGFGTYMHEDRDREKVWDLNPGLYRWGGNTSTRYNYKINAWNSANDWFFHNYSAPGPNMIDSFMEANVKNGVPSTITLPMLGWVAKDGSSCSFPRSVYPKQDRFEGDCGNGQKDGKNLESTPSRTSIAINPEFIAAWVKNLKGKFGTHPHFYILDNEPMLWHSTHRDVQPVPMSYESYLKLYLSYAKAVRKADPDAVIIGPAEWGWMGMQNSGMDVEGPWNAFKRGSDREKHGGKPFLEWFLEKVAEEEKKEKTSLLDVLDVHFYPEKDQWPKGDDSSWPVRKALFQSTKSLWDKDHTDKSWINEKINFIPRLTAMAKRFKPDAKFYIGEYNFRSEQDVSGAIAQAEVLGIFARTNLYAATYWDFPRRDGSPRFAFELFRNFDGKGSTFASRWVDNSVGSRDDVSVFSARDNKRLTVVLLNKSQKKQEFDLDLSEYGPARSARVISYEGRGGAEMKRSERNLKASKRLAINADALSMHIVELQF